MATKREELKAFKRLKREFPDNSVTLSYDLSSWRKTGCYYVTVNDVGSNCGFDSDNPMDAVDNAIERFKVIP